MLCCVCDMIGVCDVFFVMLLVLVDDVCVDVVVCVVVVIECVVC